MDGTATWRAWSVGWLGLLALALVNGTLRATLLGPRLGEENARRASTALLLAIITGYVSVLHRRRPIPTSEQARSIGLAWAALTVTVEFGLGRRVARRSWSELLADYDVTAGRLWALVPLWIAVAPVTVRRLSAPGPPSRPGA